MGLYPKGVGKTLVQWPDNDNNRVWCVDSVNGDDDYSGNSWERARASIMSAVNSARYLPGTTTIDDTKDTHDVILIAPGQYNEAVAFSGYNIHLIGLALARPGKDYGVSINYDGAVTSPAAVAMSGSGLSLHNLHVYCTEAIPAVWIAGGDNNLLENLVIECDGTNTTYGIRADSMKGSSILDCVIRTPKTAGILVAGGDNHYFIDGAIERCQINGDVAGVKGIFVENTNVVYGARIHQNWIDVDGGGATAKGIDNDATGNLFITDNYIIIHTGATAAESASHGMLNNHVTTHGTVTDPFDDD